MSNKVNLKLLSNCGQKDDEIADEIFEINSTNDDHDDQKKISKQPRHETMDLEIEEKYEDFESLTKSRPWNNKSYTKCTNRRPKSPKTYLRPRRRQKVTKSQHCFGE